MQQPDRPELPPLEDAISALAALPDGEYHLSDLFAMSPELGRAGLSLAHARMTPPSRAVRFKGASGETQLTRSARKQTIVSRTSPVIRVRDGTVTATFADERAT